MLLFNILYTYSFFIHEPMALKSSGASTASSTAISPGSRAFTARGSRSSGIRVSERKLAQ